MAPTAKCCVIIVIQLVIWPEIVTNPPLEVKEVPEAQEVVGVEITGNPGLVELVLMIYLLGLENPRMVNKWSSFDCKTEFQLFVYNLFLYQSNVHLEIKFMLNESQF